VLRYFFEAEHIAIKLNDGLVKMRRYFHGDVAASSELCVFGHVRFSMRLTFGITRSGLLPSPLMPLGHILRPRFDLIK
jgi:hypothetical protein